MIDPFQEIHLFLYSGLKNLKLEYNQFKNIHLSDVSVIQVHDDQHTGKCYITKSNGFGDEELIMISLEQFVLSKFDLDKQIMEAIKLIRSAFSCLSPLDQQNYLSNIYVDIYQFKASVNVHEDSVSKIIYEKLHELDSHLHIFYPENYHPHEVKGILEKLNWQGSLISLITFFVTATSKSNEDQNVMLYKDDASLQQFICSSFTWKGKDINLASLKRSWGVGSSRLNPKAMELAKEIFKLKD